MRVGSWSLFVSLAVAGAASGGGAPPAVASASASAQAGTVVACVGAKGAMRLATGSKCRRGERKLTLLKAPGTTGPQGPKGDTGAPGAAGAKGDTGASGANGANGVAGANGDTGAQGIQGPAGSADTPAQVLAKLLQVDGAGSALDADLLGGLPSASWQRRGTTTTCLTG